MKNCCSARDLDAIVVSPAPFTFFPNSASPGNVTFGVLGTPITLDGEIELDVAVSAFAERGSIKGYWGDGVTPTAFPITVPEPACLLYTSDAADE